MTKTLKEVKLEGLKKQLDIKLKQLEELYVKLANDRTGSAKPSIEAEIQQLEQEAEVLEQQISNSESEVVHQALSPVAIESQGEYQKQVRRIADTAWEKDLHKIDYRQAETKINAQLRLLELTAGNALFLLKEAHRFKGDLCLRYIQDPFSSCCGRNLYELEVNFESTQAPAIDVFTSKLAERLNIQAESDGEQLLQSFQSLEKILAASSGLFFKMEIQSRVAANNEFLPWFLNTFWGDFEQRLSQVRRVRPDLSVVVAVLIDGSLPESLEVQVCSDDRAQLSERFLNLPVESWLAEDITRWLGRFSALPPPKCKEIAEAVYDSAGGNPCMTHVWLSKELAKLAS
jgi:hypothetical protein